MWLPTPVQPPAENVLDRSGPLGSIAWSAPPAMPSSVQGASVSPGLRRRTVPACVGLPLGIAVLGTCPRAEHAFAVLLPSWRWKGFLLVSM